ncbi:MAG: helix-turn-helix transcriptional regulator [Bacteroidales bacterium]|nr:helix-turn-helix transcriptional regulator [Bacteroidales bacterium]
MKHSNATELLFNQVIDETPPEIKQEVEWSYSIADKIYEALRRKGLSQKEFARLVGTSEAAVSKWIGGGHNFTLSTLAKISMVLGVDMIKV